MWNRRRTRLLRGLVLGLAVALAAVPLAQARLDEGAKRQAFVPPTASDELAADWQGYVAGVTRTPEQLELTAETQAYVARATRTPEQLELAAETQAYVAAAAPLTPQPTQVGTNPSDGFNWGDAGLGAGTVFAVMLLGAGVLLATRQLGHRATI